MKKRSRSFLVLLIVLFTCRAFAQPGGPLVKFSDLDFKNDAEKATFSKLNDTKDTTQVFDLLFCSYDKSKRGDKAAALKKIDDAVAYLQAETRDKPEIKKVKTTYDYIHRQFLKVYREKNSFMDIFDNGEYNCLSASALYAIVFTKLSIPYQVRETPTHVYLLAYPNTAKVLIESTAPNKGYYQFSSSFISNFVKNMYDSKLITKEEYATVPQNDLFNKYYFTSDNISLFALSGLQYSNFAIYALESDDYKTANDEIRKGYFIFQGEKHKYILKSTTASLLDKNGYGDPANIDNLVILCRFNNLKDEQTGNELILSEFVKVLQTQLIKNSDYDMFERSYRKIDAELKDSALKNEIGFDYHYELSRLGYMNSKSAAYEMEHLEAAYKLNQLNANLRTLVYAVFDQQLRRFNDSKSIMEVADNFALKFPFLEENDMFLSVKANCILDLAYQSYYFSSLAKGDAYIKEFEELAKANTNISATATFVEKAYSQGASEYYRKGNLAKSKQLIKSGLTFAPNSFGLQQRLNQFR